MDSTPLPTSPDGTSQASSVTASPSATQAERAEEQVFVDTAYTHLDQARAYYTERLKRVRLQQGHESAGSRSERDSFAEHYEDNLWRLRNVEHRLVLGRLNYLDGTSQHVGRISLREDSGDILLQDWRAASSAAFYQATPVNNMGLERKRHIHTTQRTVTGVEDEFLSGDSPANLRFTGEGALMAAMSQARTKKMGDIVATIQSEQDAIIRASSRGALVLQGGPGTGKTAVALHRAAYLLYQERERLSRQGVLLIGPSRAFLRYIDQVLPALGESDVVATTIGSLVPGYEATEVDTPEVADIKGRLVWRKILPHAVRTLLERPLKHEVSFDVAGVRVRLTQEAVARAQANARRGGFAHNAAREAYNRELIAELGGQIARAKKLHLDDNPWIRAEVVDSRDARREINLRWMPAKASEFLARLFSQPHLLAQVAPELSDAERALLHRPSGAPLTVEDIPLIDILESLLGSFESAFTSRKSEQADTSFAERTIETMNVGGGIVSASMLAARFADRGGYVPLAERAAADREWTYGHVIVDEAQELSPLAWAMLIERCPSHSFTIVGDLDQRRGGAPAGGWAELLGGLALSLHEEVLSISYRTPHEVLSYARAVMEAMGVQVAQLEGAREIPGSVTITALSPTNRDAHVDALCAAVENGLALMDAQYGKLEGQLALIAPEPLAAQLTALINDSLREGSNSASNDAASRLGELLGSARVSVMTPAQSKGLEYDVVVVAYPEDMRSQPGDLYVALTRCTRSLTVVTSDAKLASLAVTANSSAAKGNVHHPDAL